jgi:prepilin signal peptidase PulO-like enzyme (type II secretory pathway)
MKIFNSLITDTRSQTDMNRLCLLHIIIINLITLLNIYLLGNIHLSQIVGGIRLSKEKEIHHLP